MVLIKQRIIWFLLSALLVAASFFVVFQYGLKFSIDFTGGSLTEVRYVEGRPIQEAIESEIRALNLGGFSIRPSGENSYVVRTREMSQAERAALRESLGGIIERETSIGPTAGAELKGKAMKAIVVVVVMIVLFITFAFRKVSMPVSSWKYGLATIVALAHDVIIPTGIFVFLGYELDLLFVTGLLAILGYSVHDTIVVFDRVRENLRINKENNVEEEFENTVGESLTQTITRSINTSVTIFITLLALYLFGSHVTQTFSLLLIIGLIAGTYSSIFIASPLLVTFYKFQHRK